MSPTDDNIFKALFDALDPIIELLMEIIPPPINFAVAFIWGGIEEIITEVLFG